MLKKYSKFKKGMYEKLQREQDFRHKTYMQAQEETARRARKYFLKLLCRCWYRSAQISYVRYEPVINGIT